MDTSGTEPVPLEPSELQTLLAQAAAPASLGLVVRTNDRELLRKLLAKERDASEDPAIRELNLRLSPLEEDALIIASSDVGPLDELDIEFEEV